MEEVIKRVAPYTYKELILPKKSFTAKIAWLFDKNNPGNKLSHIKQFRNPESIVEQIIEAGKNSEVLKLLSSHWLEEDVMNRPSYAPQVNKLMREQGSGKRSKEELEILVSDMIERSKRKKDAIKVRFDPPEGNT